ncbi:MAG: 23S rRNA (guanosine(2251)-2'-O)-methyltransferase RlmB [Cellvibrionales bacterium]|nr:23S rRNA (guanosine(2251)-2'-O)-methyltransferase RlmB [Cellvibrionales bacterium]
MNKPDHIYGLHAVQSILKHQPHQVTLVLYDKNRRDQRLQNCLSLAEKQGIKSEPRKRQTLDELTDNAQHQGIVIEYTEPEESISLTQRIESAENPLLLILDGVTDPHNLGACLRTADAAGATAVIYPKDKSASLTPTVRKVACGAAETMPTYAVTNLARTLDELKNLGVWLVGTSGNTEQSLYNVDLAGPIGIVMGAEGKGIRRLTAEKCDYLTKLPMAGSVSSLNVSVATGICLYEAVRQRTTT